MNIVIRKLRGVACEILNEATPVEKAGLTLTSGTVAALTLAVALVEELSPSKPQFLLAASTILIGMGGARIISRAQFIRNRVRQRRRRLEHFRR